MIDYSKISTSDILIANPVGIDAVIQRIQTELSNEIGWLNIVFGKAYRNEVASGEYMPMVKISSTSKDYSEVLPDDRINMAFFDVSQTVEYNSNERYFNPTIKIIIFVNIESIYPELTHRATEEVKKDVMSVLQSYKSDCLIITSMIEGVQNVYSSYNYAFPEARIDYEPFFVFAIEGNVKYSINNCNTI